MINIFLNKSYYFYFHYGFHNKRLAATKYSDANDCYLRTHIFAVDPRIKNKIEKDIIGITYL